MFAERPSARISKRLGSLFAAVVARAEEESQVQAGARGQFDRGKTGQSGDHRPWWSTRRETASSTDRSLSQRQYL